MNKKILALDQATRDSGWSFFVGEQLTAFGHWSFTDTQTPQRIHKLCQQIALKIEEYEPDLIVIENIQLQQNNVEMYQKLAWVQGAIIELCISKHLPFEIVRPTEWRKMCHFLQGQDKHRDNQKKIAQSWVLETFQQKCTQDEADAICIGHAIAEREANILEF